MYSARISRSRELRGQLIAPKSIYDSPVDRVPVKNFATKFARSRRSDLHSAGIIGISEQEDQ
jgi:hypothetical protein